MTARAVLNCKSILVISLRCGMNPMLEPETDVVSHWSFVVHPVRQRPALPGLFAPIAVWNGAHKKVAQKV
jgi:hypothetical protein